MRPTEYLSFRESIVAARAVSGAAKGILNGARMVFRGIVRYQIGAAIQYMYEYVCTSWYESSMTETSAKMLSRDYRMTWGGSRQFGAQVFTQRDGRNVCRLRIWRAGMSLQSELSPAAGLGYPKSNVAITRLIPHFIDMPKENYVRT